jgi:hypothetical protein
MATMEKIIQTLLKGNKQYSIQLRQGSKVVTERKLHKEVMLDVVY